MDTTVRTRPHLLIAGAVALVAIGLAAVVGLVPSRNAAPPAGVVSAKPTEAAPGRAGNAACASCGTVEAIRTVVVVGAADGVRRTVYRITVRMDDGSFRTLSQASPPSVAVGEAVRITDGAVMRPPSPDAKG
jgi:hypothetical protein